MINPDIEETQGMRQLRTTMTVKGDFSEQVSYENIKDASQNMHEILNAAGFERASALAIYIYGALKIIQTFPAAKQRVLRLTLAAMLTPSEKGKAE